MTIKLYANEPNAEEIIEQKTGIVFHTVWEEMGFEIIKELSRN